MLETIGTWLLVILGIIVGLVILGLSSRGGSETRYYYQDPPQPTPRVTKRERSCPTTNLDLYVPKGRLLGDLSELRKGPDLSHLRDYPNLSHLRRGTSLNMGLARKLFIPQFEEEELDD